MIESKPYQPIKPLEYAKFLQKLLTISGLTISELAIRIERTEDFINQHLRLLNDKDHDAESRTL